MSIEIVDNCVGCSSIYGSCMRSACPNYRHKAIICDNCGAEVEFAYIVPSPKLKKDRTPVLDRFGRLVWEDDHFCQDCLEQVFDTIDAESEEDDG